jgi:hypothetical protein
MNHMTPPPNLSFLVCINDPSYSYYKITVVHFHAFLTVFPHFQDDTLLVIAWGTSIKITSIKTNQSTASNGSYRPVPVSSMNQVDIVASFSTSYFISGIAPFGDSLVVLAYIPGEEDGEKEFSSSVPYEWYFFPPMLYDILFVPCIHDFAPFLEGFFSLLLPLKC